MEVQVVPGFGRAAVATRDYAAGEVVLEEAPFLVWDGEDGSEACVHLAAVVAHVNAEFESDPAVHAVDTDSAYILSSYAQLDRDRQAMFVAGDCFCSLCFHFFLN